MTTQEALRQAAARIARSSTAQASREALANSEAGTTPEGLDEDAFHRGVLEKALEFLLAEIDRQAAS